MSDGKTKIDLFPHHHKEAKTQHEMHPVLKNTLSKHCIALQRLSIIVTQQPRCWIHQRNYTVTNNNNTNSIHGNAQQQQQTQQQVINKRGLIWSKYDDDASEVEASNPNSDQSSLYLHSRKIDEMIRVDHAGEFGAVTICKAQMLIMNNDPVLNEILSQENDHFARFEDMIFERRVRPTVLRPIWRVAGSIAGVGTALMGREAAMACHHAVEEVISDHYNEQLREIYDLNEAMSQKQRDIDFERMMQEGGDQSKSEEEITDYFFSSPAMAQNQQRTRKEEELLDVVKRFRDDELHHHELAEQNRAMEAPFYQILYQSIKNGCKAAIWLTKRF